MFGRKAAGWRHQHRKETNHWSDLSSSGTQRQGRIQVTTNGLVLDVLCVCF